MYWDKRRFGLKPLGVTNDGKTLKVQFFWLSEYNFERSLDLRGIPWLSSNLDHDQAESVLYNRETKKEICSGDIIEITTQDPKECPLPDVRLLDLLWVLHRLMAIREASEEHDDYDDQPPRVPSWLLQRTEIVD
jgi:hypothetical protein